MTGAAVRVPFAAPLIGEPEITAVSQVLRSGWIGTGAVAGETERRFAEYLGVEHALLLNSCTAALHLALLSHGIGRGDEVIVPTVTFTATAAAVIHTGALPVLVDVEPRAFTIDPAQVRRRINDRTRAVVAVHFAGRMADVLALGRLCDEHGRLLIEDSAHALPAERDGATPGALSDAAAFSFFVTKPLTSAEGGLLVTRNADSATRARVLSVHGIDREAFARHRPGRSPHYDVIAPGLKYNMPDTAAAMVACQLDRADATRERRRDIAERYLNAFRAAPGLVMPPEDTADNASSWHLFVVQLRVGTDRDAFAAGLYLRGVGTSVHFRPLHRFSYYRAALPSADDPFPVAEQAFPRLLSLPIHPSMTDSDIDVVIDAVLAQLREGPI